MRILNALAVKVIKAYRLGISPYLGANCKYVPSCSEYACECFAHYGFLKGLGLSLWRILRCNPWSHGGYDPAVKQISR